MIISLLNQKGGVGKTTLSVNIAAGLAAKGARVLLLDVDPQGSSLDWAAAREGESSFPVLGLPRATLHKEIGKFTRDYDYIIIDGPPRVTDLARSAIMAADLVLIPVQPSPYDVWAAQEVVSLIHEAKVYKESLKSAFVINRKIRFSKEADFSYKRDHVPEKNQYPPTASWPFFFPLRSFL